jgi:ABC-type uncharacterized transport system permease subunit
VLYSAIAKAYIHPLCPIKEMCVCAFLIAILCGAQSTLHSCAISIIQAKFHLPKIKTSFMVNFFHVFFIILRNNQLKNISDEFFKSIAQTGTKHHWAHLPLLQNSP